MKGILKLIYVICDLLRKAVIVTAFLILADKYDLTQHPNYYLTADADKRNWFDVGKYLDHKVEP